MTQSLCITADDYGLSQGINAAIESLARASRISAVSVMGHRDADLSTAKRLADTGISVGVHLCFTHERPLTQALGLRLPPTYAHLFGLVVTQPSLLKAFVAEAEAQVEHLRRAGLKLQFLNAHEHVHLFPVLWPAMVEVARRQDLRAVRVALGQPVDLSQAGALALASRLSWAHAPMPNSIVSSPLGVGVAGRLTSNLVDTLLARPFADASHVVRELCVHPAFDDVGRRAEYDMLHADHLDVVIARHGLKRLQTLPLPH